MRSELRACGHDVTVCAEGKTAVKALEKAAFDAAILDLAHARSSPVSRSLTKSRQVSADTEVVIMTGMPASRPD